MNNFKWVEQKGGGEVMICLDDRTVEHELKVAGVADVSKEMFEKHGDQVREWMDWECTKGETYYHLMR